MLLPHSFFSSRWKQVIPLGQWRDLHSHHDRHHLAEVLTSLGLPSGPCVLSHAHRGADLYKSASIFLFL
jgi:hypothetical protein